MLIIEGAKAKREEANRTELLANNNFTDGQNLLVKRPKKFDVRKKLKFQNGVLVPTSKVEKEAVRMGRSVHNEIRQN